MVTHARFFRQTAFLKIFPPVAACRFKSPGRSRRFSNAPNTACTSLRPAPPITTRLEYFLSHFFRLFSLLHFILFLFFFFCFRWRITLTRIFLSFHRRWPVVVSSAEIHAKRERERERQRGEGVDVQSTFFFAKAWDSVALASRFERLFSPTNEKYLSCCG